MSWKHTQTVLTLSSSAIMTAALSVAVEMVQPLYGALTEEYGSPLWYSTWQTTIIGTWPFGCFIGKDTHAASDGFCSTFPTPSVQTNISEIERKFYTSLFFSSSSEQSIGDQKVSKLGVEALTWTADDICILTAVSDYTIKVWESSTGKLITEFRVSIIVTQNIFKIIEWVVVHIQG